jgi:hypothetical protein
MGITLSCENKQNILIEKSKFGTGMTLKSRREPRTQNPEPKLSKTINHGQWAMEFRCWMNTSI